MPALPRYLTKSRFKLALECPTKLFYAGKPEWLDTSLDDSFLAALAEGGYQVGALACQMFPGGVAVEALDHASAMARTQELLAQQEVTIYEAALVAGDLFIRVDILRKRGSCIELIEVKAKSYNPQRDGDFRNRKGEIDRGFKPYLQDIAFQTHVARLALPGFEIRSFLMLADTSRRASVDGLNQHFRVRRDGKRLRVQAPPEGTDLGQPILIAVAVDGQVAQLLAEPITIGGTAMPFTQAVALLAQAYREDRVIAPRPGTACAACQFKAASPPAPGTPQSGFHACWAQAFGWTATDFEAGTVLDLWNFRKKQQLIDQGVLKLQQVQAEDLGFGGSEPGPEGLTRAQRQWYQCRPEWPGGGDHYFDEAGFARAARDWVYPLHFIDFETSAVAIPFHCGQRPYQTVAFQFSHHVMERDGSVRHCSQFLEASPGVDPCLPFLRALRTALSSDSGTVFRWAAHENTVLNQLRERLLADANPPDDAPQLVAFIEGLTQRDIDGVCHAGARNMVDLCQLAERLYFHPDTQGSSSLKKVLPALMKSSPTLRALYAEPRYGSPAMPSLNLKQGMAWWVERTGRVLDPYKLLPPVFEDLDAEAQERLDSQLAPDLANGGAAMAAYACLQFEDLGAAERERIKAALLRYCELDTLAMVMVVQAFLAKCT